MSLERVAMKGKLVEMQGEEKKLLLRGDGLCASIRQGLNTTLTPFAEQEIPLVASQMDDLVMTWATLQKVQSDVAKLQRELR